MVLAVTVGAVISGAAAIVVAVLLPARGEDLTRRV
jgi:hypothetical protein